MKLLAEKDYHKAIIPLKQVTINNLFARSVVEQKVKGKIYVDNVDNPKTFYIIHPYGMTLLFGATDNKIFNTSFKDYALNIHNNRTTHEWMQAFPDSWDNILQDLFKDCLIKSADTNGIIDKGMIELNTRVNFKFNKAKYLSRKKTELSADIKILRTDRQIFRDMKGSVVPMYFWENEDDFLKNGIGFSLFYKNKLASTAYSSFIHDTKLELGIETVEGFRGKGFAEQTCSTLIDYCVDNNFEPVWACRLENIGSYKLAKKIGFEPSAEIPYYRLSK